MSAPTIDLKAVEEWLKQRLAEDIRMGWVSAAGSFLAGLVVLVITFWCIYAVVWMGFAWWLPLPQFLRGLISVVVLVLLFVGNAKIDREYLAEYSFTTSGSDNKVVTFFVPGIGFGSNLHPLAPDTLHSGVKMITNVAFAGPRLLNAALRLARQSQRLATLDTGIAAWILSALLNRRGRVPVAELASQMDGYDPSEVFPALRDIEGVIFLNEPPPGLSLTAEFRGEMLNDLQSAVRGSK